MPKKKEPGETSARLCVKCGGPIPPTKRSDAIYCGQSCRAAAEKKRYKDTHPEYVERQNELVRRWRHIVTYGHTKFLEDPLLNSRDRFAKARAMGYRSGLEVTVANQLKAAGIDFGYETVKLPFTQPVKPRHYTPDMILPNGIIVETKGRFLTDDRVKHKLVKDQHPDLDIRFVFSNANTRLSKGSPTTYGKWCQNHGFAYASRLIPQEWVEEAPCQKRIDALLGIAILLKSTV